MKAGGILFIVFVVCFSIKLSWNSQYLRLFQNSLQKWQVSSDLHFWGDEFILDQEKLRTKFNDYEAWLTESHLDEGMVVNRNHEKIINECDSLLFSSLRFVALKRTRHSHAESAWEGLVNSYEKFGRWVRHPKCANQALSRDMLLGVILAILHGPIEEAKPLFVELMQSIDQRGGYIANGPFYISLVTPGILEMMRRISIVFSVSSELIPERFQYGFSTVEWSTLSNPEGYRTHLIALQIWIEIFLKEEMPYNIDGEQRSFLSSFDDVFTYYRDLHSQRLIWSLQNLVVRNSNNLFFKWLYLKANSATSPGLRHQIISELLKMTQFPNRRLPNHCDRKADYLWQREESEYKKGLDCTLRWAGVDFLWMASLLIVN